ncbi:MAG: hypothetical protein H6Q70_1663 [Firmicutes bacterium]|nr:hypothetical protein [Bacillota bacterium]
MQKNLLINNGYPMSVNILNDLKPVKRAYTDSWYLKTEFMADDKQLGFTWHQMIQPYENETKVSVESLFMNATDDIWLNNKILSSPNTENGVSDDKMHCFSSWGNFSGDLKHMTLDLKIGNNEIHMNFIPNGEILYNGGTGLIEFGSMASYQFSSPNMKMEGTFVLQGHEYKVKNATAWFDRQYGIISNRPEEPKLVPGKSTWLWIGHSSLQGSKGAVSLWDVYNKDEKNAFGTFLHKDGSMTNAVADITYDNIWISKESGHSYPNTIKVDIPVEDYHVLLTCLSSGSNAEFVHEEVKALSGCQCLYKITGNYQGKIIDSVVDVEMIGDLCGEN